MPYVNVLGSDLHYEASGRGQPLVLLHNGLGSTRSFLPQTAEFARISRVIAYDRRGYGRSTHIKRIYKNWVERSVTELTSFLDKLEIKKTQLCGVCAGGAIALFFAAANPERTSGVVAAGTCCYGEDETRSRVLRVYPSPEELPPDLLEELAELHGERYAKQFYEIFHQAMTKEDGYPFKGYDVRPTLPRVKCPVKVIYGDRDRLFDLEQALAMYRHLPNAELCVIPGCGHLPNQERPREFNREVISFVRKHPNGCDA